MKKTKPTVKRDRARDEMRAAFKAFCERKGMTYQSGWKRRKATA